MDEKEANFMMFWEKHKNRKWRFRIIVGLIFGFFILAVFATKTYFFGKQEYDSIFDYILSKQFLIQFTFLVPICGWICGWLIYRYCVRTEEKIIEKYHER